MTGNGRHRTGIFSWSSPRFIPGYENSRLDQKNLGQPCITPGQTSKNSMLDQFLDREYFPVLSLIVSTASPVFVAKTSQAWGHLRRRFGFLGTYSISNLDELQARTTQGIEGTYSMVAGNLFIQEFIYSAFREPRCRS